MGPRTFVWLVSLVLLAAVTSLSLSSCGGGGGGGSRPIVGPGDEVIITPPGANRAPMIERSFEDITLTLEAGRTVQRDLGDIHVYFSDPDNNLKEFKVETDNALVADIVFNRPGPTLLVQAVGTGTSTITVTVTDTEGLSATQSFTVNVNGGTALPPDHSDTLDGASDIAPGQTVEGYIDSPNDVDYFRLRLAESGTISVTIDAEPGVEIAVLDADGNVLAVAETASEATVSVTSRAGERFLRVLKRTVRVVSKPVRYVLKKVRINAETLINIIKGIPDFTVDVGQTSISIDLTEYFESSDGSPLAFRASASYAESIAVTVQRSNLMISAAHGVTPGPVTVTVSASLPGERAVDVFTVTVREAPNQPPLVTKAFPPRTVTPGCSASLDLNEFFADEGRLRFRVERGNLHKYDTSVSGYIRSFVSGDGRVEFSAIAPGVNNRVRDIPPGPRDFDVTATDIEGLEAQQKLILLYRVPDELAVRAPQPFTVGQGESRTIDLRDYFRSPDDEPIVFIASLGQGSRWPILDRSDLAAGTLTIVTRHDPVGRSSTRVGSYTVEVTALGQCSLSRKDLNFNFAVVEGAPPRIIDGSPPLLVSVPAGGEVNLTLTDYIEDPSGGTLTFAHGSLPRGFGVTRNGPEWTIATQPDAAVGNYTITVTATARNSQAANFDLQVIVEEARDGTEPPVGIKSPPANVASCLALLETTLQYLYDTYRSGLGTLAPVCMAAYCGNAINANTEKCSCCGVVDDYINANPPRNVFIDEYVLQCQPDPEEHLLTLQGVVDGQHFSIATQHDQNLCRMEVDNNRAECQQVLDEELLPAINQFAPTFDSCRTLFNAQVRDCEIHFDSERPKC